ncbi:MAG: hypothetical protein K8T25_07110 [Planctomycetia bacterium]|nr:hypothetical protein [Planctomycetia bacterium]
MLADLVRALFNTGNNWWNTWTSWIMGQIIGLINSALSALPGGWQSSIETIRQWIEVANSWFPIDYCCQLWIAYITFAIGWWFLQLCIGFLGVKAPST